MSKELCGALSRSSAYRNTSYTCSVLKMFLRHSKFQSMHLK
uniref:Uncharacterized protein n=1 Tax=Arundo donax TaxID=35708 RepID=A0A0A9CHN1_ARUDO